MNKVRPKKYAMVIDTFKCIDCKACMIGCKVENQVPKGYWRNWIRPAVNDKGQRVHFQPGQCMQCDVPSCVSACPVDATYKQKDGIVAIDPAKCIGCGNCVTACPYGARYRHPTLRTADKCDFCQHKLSRNEEPACVETCPTKARVFGDMNDPSSRISVLMKQEKLVRVVNPVIDTRPNIFYLAGTRPMDWPKEPTLPGNVHMPPVYWRT